MTGEQGYPFEVEYAGCQGENPGGAGSLEARQGECPQNRSGAGPERWTTLCGQDFAAGMRALRTIRLGCAGCHLYPTCRWEAEINRLVEAAIGQVMRELDLDEPGPVVQLAAEKPPLE